MLTEQTHHVVDFLARALELVGVAIILIGIVLAPASAGSLTYEDASERMR